MKKIQARKSQKTEDRRIDARNARKAASRSVFPMICGSGGSTNRLAKAAGAEPRGQRRSEQLCAAVVPTTFSSKNA